MSSLATRIPPEGLPSHTTGPRASGWWGMVLFICSEAMLFAVYFASYIYLWGGMKAFAAEGGKYPPLKLAIPMTVLLTCSSVAMWWAERGIERGDQSRLRLGMAISWLLGAAFLVLQAIEYSHREYGPRVSAYDSVFYTITATHGLHLLLGLLMSLWTQLRAWLGHFTRHDHLAVQNTGLYIHFVDTVWLFILFILYLSPRFWTP